MNVAVTMTQVEGALANGTRVVKLLKVSDNETVQVGTYATILGSMRLEDKDSTLVYCLKYDGIEAPVHQVYLPGRFRVVQHKA